MALESEKKPSQRERKKEESRQAIARAAVRLFEEKGYDATTMDEIALSAGVSRPTVFNYFARKEDILLVLGVMMGRRMAAQLVRPEEGAMSKDPIDTLRSVVVAMAASFAEYPETSRAFHYLRVQAMRAHPRGSEQAAASPGDNEFIQVTRFLEGVIAEAQIQRAIRADFPPREILAHLLIGIFASAMAIWSHQGGEPARLVELVERHFDIALNGIRA